MVRSKPGLINCFRLAGVIKILETFAIFTCLMLHRIGAVGTQVFFGAADLVLDAADPDYPTEVDAEIIGGVTMAFSVITPAILLAYSIEGTKAVQRTSLDALFCLSGAIMLITTGGMTCFAWNNANAMNASLSRRDFEAAGALGIMCIATGILYFLDFFYVVYQREVIKREEEDGYY